MIDTKAVRSRVLNLAKQGKLTEQLESDGTAENLYLQIQAEKQRLIKEGRLKKGKQLPDIRPDEVPFEIPENWKWVRVGNIAEVAGGTTAQISETSNSGSIPYFKVSDMNTIGNERQMIYANAFISDGYAGKIFPAGTTIFPKNGGAALTNKRRILVVPSAVDLNTGVCFPIIESMSEWISFFMNTVDMGRIDTGSNIPTANSTNLKKQLVFLPPLAEQKRIVEKVEQIFRILDSIDEAQEKYSADVDSLKAKLITAGIQGKLTEQLESDGTAEELYQHIQAEKQKLIKEGKIKKEKPLPEIKPEEIPFEIPGNWKWIRLKDIVYLNSGDQYTELNNGIPYVKVADMNLIKNNSEIVTSSRFASEDNAGIISRYSIIFPKRGGAILTNKKRKVICTPIFIDSNIMAMTMIEKDSLEYVRYWFESIVLGSLYTGTSTPQINNKDIYPLLIPLPPLAEQKRIVDVLEKALGALG